MRILNQFLYSQEFGKCAFGRELQFRFNADLILAKFVCSNEIIREFSSLVAKNKPPNNFSLLQRGYICCWVGLSRAEFASSGAWSVYINAFTVEISPFHVKLTRYVHCECIKLMLRSVNWAQLRPTQQHIHTLCSFNHRK